MQTNAMANCNLKTSFNYKTKGLKVAFYLTSGSNYSGVEWNFGDGTSANDLNTKHTYASKGVKYFTLTLWNNNGCSETFEGKVYVFDHEKKRATQQNKLPKAVAVPINYTNNALHVSNLENKPNPVRTVTNINFEMLENTTVLLELFDMKGQKIKTLLHKTLQKGKQELPFNRRSMLAGTYVLRLRANKEILSTKMIVL
jgi:hypothetical protein